MVERIIAYLFGYVVITVTGPNRVRFVNRCLQLGIPQWGVRARDGRIILRTTIAGFVAMRKPAHENRCVVRVLLRRGFPFFVQRLRRRGAFSLGAAMFIVLLWLLSSFVWFIEVDPSQAVDSATLNEYLRVQGVFVGAMRHSLQQEAIASAILREFPELAWAGLSIEGSRVHVRLVDKDTIVPIVRIPGDIVASKAGVLTKVIATSGQAVAKPGQTVTLGQIIIRGSVIIEGQVANEVMAEGYAEARVWYEAWGQGQLSRSIEVPTGAQAVTELIRLAGIEVVVAGARSNPYALYETALVKRVLLPGVEHITITYREMSLKNEAVSVDQALSDASLQAEASLHELLPTGVTIVDQQLTEEWSQDGNTVTVRILVETQEDIGTFIPY